jgi:catechol 2,3-dioxygenase-like lactoylglutathione lyase family enzyme
LPGANHARPRHNRSQQSDPREEVLRLRPKSLGIERLYAEGQIFSGYGADKKAVFWIGARDAVITGAHVAFTAPDRATVDAFHAAALAAGGRDNGGPGPRPNYHRHYYGAFVLDPDGHNIEAVCHTPVEG